MLEINKIHRGDCLELLQQLPANSVDLIITDPPYPLFWNSLFNSQLQFQKACNIYKPNDCSYPHNRILRTSEVFYVCSKTKELCHDGEIYIHDCLLADHTKKESWYHPAAKNLRVIRTIVKSSSLNGGVVLDPFIGSGTTAVACKQTGRNFIGMELSEEYIKIANKRLAQQNLNLFLSNNKLLSSMV